MKNEKGTSKWVLIFIIALNHSSGNLLVEIFCQADGHSYDGRRTAGTAGHRKSQTGL